MAGRRLRVDRHTWRAGGVARNTVLMGVNQIVRFGVGIVMLPILIDRLGADRTGLFLFAITLTGYFTAVEYSLATSLTKYVAQFRATGEARELNSYVRGTFLLLLVFGVLVAAVLAVLGVTGGTALFGETVLKSQATPTILVAALVSLAYWPTRLGPAALQGLERYDSSALIAIGAAVASLGGIVALTEVTRSVPVLVGMFGGVLVAQNLVALALAWRQLGLRRRLGEWRGRHMRSILGFGGALFVIGIGDTLVYSLDRTIVAGFVGAAAIVVYEIALRLQSGVRTVSSLAGGALISTSARLIAQRRHERLRELVLIGSYLGVMITAPVAVLLTILAGPTIEVWIGQDYARYAYLAQIFVSFWILSSNTGVLGSAITGTGRLGLFAGLGMIGSVVSLGLSVWLTAEWGTIGVILGTVIPSVVGLPIWMYFVLRRLDVPIRAYLRQVVVPAYTYVAGWSAAVLLLDHVLAPSGFIGLALFTSIALLAFWGAALPTVRVRWQRAVRGELAPHHG